MEIEAARLGKGRGQVNLSSRGASATIMRYQCATIVPE